MSYARAYNLTPTGSRLANYLLWLDTHPPAAPAVPPEQFDDDRHQPRREQLDRLYEELDEAMDDLRRPNLTDSAFEEYHLRVQEIRRAISEIEVSDVD